MAIIVDDNGTLDCFVLQKQTSNLDLGLEDAKYEETWKGPKSQIDAIADGGLSLYGKAFALNQARPDVKNDDSFIAEYDPPTFDDKDYAWMIDSISVDDSDAGSQVLVKVKYRAENPNGGGWEGSDADTVKETRWRLSWGDRGATVLAYLDPQKDGAFQRGYVIDESMIDSTKYPSNGKLKTVPAFKGFVNRSAQSEKYTSSPYQFVKGVAIYEVSTNPELRRAADYYSAGLNPQLHYPILTRTTASKRPVKSIDGSISTTRPYQSGDEDSTKVEWDKKKNTRTTTQTTVDRDAGTTTTTVTIDSMVGVDIDRISDPPDGMPFRFQKTYKWLKVADDIQQTDNGYERNEVWWGDFEWNEDFYGANAWEIGTLGE